MRNFDRRAPIRWNDLKFVEDLPWSDNYRCRKRASGRGYNNRVEQTGLCGYGDDGRLRRIAFRALSWAGMRYVEENLDFRPLGRVIFLILRNLIYFNLLNYKKIF